MDAKFIREKQRQTQLVVPQGDGASQGEQLRTRKAAYAALHAAVKALETLAPKGAEYTNQKDYACAAEQHVGRLSLLRALMDDLDAECVVIWSQTYGPNPEG